MALSIVKEDNRFRVEWQGNSTDWLPETPSNRKVVLVFLSWLRDENGNPVSTFQELSKIVDSEKRQASSCHVEGFRECSCDFLKYLTRKRKIDSEVVEALSQELRETPLSAINEPQQHQEACESRDTRIIYTGFTKNGLHSVWRCITMEFPCRFLASGWESTKLPY